jgi:hypothetical protein
LVLQVESPWGSTITISGRLLVSLIEFRHICRRIPLRLRDGSVVSTQVLAVWL